MYLTKAERELARSTAYLRLAQEGLASARRLGHKDMVRRFEDHVKRNLTYVANAQDWVLRQRKRDPGSIFVRLMEIPVSHEVAA